MAGALLSDLTGATRLQCIHVRPTHAIVKIVIASEREKKAQMREEETDPKTKTHENAQNKKESQTLELAVNVATKATVTQKFENQNSQRETE